MMMLPYLGLLLALGQVSVVQLRPQLQNQPDINQPWQPFGGGNTGFNPGNNAPISNANNYAPLDSGDDSGFNSGSNSPLGPPSGGFANLIPGGSGFNPGNNAPLIPPSGGYSPIYPIGDSGFNP